MKKKKKKQKSAVVFVFNGENRDKNMSAPFRRPCLSLDQLIDCAEFNFKCILDNSSAIQVQMEAKVFVFGFCVCVCASVLSVPLA